jgi:hypothetical protein
MLGEQQLTFVVTVEQFFSRDQLVMAIKRNLLSVIRNL